MALVYKFKKERLKSDQFVFRPRILVVLSGAKDSIRVPALLDSGCDRTVIPESIARFIGLDLNGPKTEIMAYRECNEAIETKANFTFVGRVERNSVRLANVPVLVSLEKEGHAPEEDIVLGVDGIFDEFEVTFKKAANCIILKKVVKTGKF